MEAIFKSILWCYFLHQINFERSNEQNTFFFSILCGKAEKDQNTLFGYKKGSKSNINIIFEIFGGYLYNNSGNIFRIKSILKNLMSKMHFSLAFYAKKLKNHKIHFLVTKSGQNYNLITFLDLRPKNCIYFISNFLWTWALHTSSGGVWVKEFW